MGCGFWMSVRYFLSVVDVQAPLVRLLLHSGSFDSLKIKIVAYHERVLPRSSCESNGGEGGIRTLEALADLHAFQACALGHYATSPCIEDYGRK